MKTTKTSKGFTIVEVLIAIALGGILVILLNQVVTNYLHISQRGRYLSLANSFVDGKVEALRSAGFNSLSNGTSNLTSSLSSQLPPSRSASMTITSSITGIKQIELTVSYHEQGQTNVHNYTTYIGELGVGQ